MDGWKAFGISVLSVLYVWISYMFLYWEIGINTAMYVTTASYVFALVSAIAVCRMSKGGTPNG